MYRDLGLPHGWEVVAAALSPPAPTTESIEAIAVHDDFEQTMASLQENERFTLALRAVGTTLSVIGEFLNITRERVRQIEKKATKKALSTSSPLRQKLKAWLKERGVDGHAIVHFTTSEASLGSLGSISEIDAWRIISLILRQTDERFELLPIGDHRFAILSLEGRYLARVSTVARGSSVLLTALALERDSGVSKHLLQHAPEIFDGLQMTASGLFYSSKWTNLQMAHAVALELIAAGKSAWHFSELGSLLRKVAPKRFETSTARDFAALVSRPESRFIALENAGRWTLEATEAEWMVLQELGRPNQRSTLVDEFLEPRQVTPEKELEPSRITDYATDFVATSKKSVPTPEETAETAKTDKIPNDEVRQRILALLREAPVHLTTIEIARQLSVERRTAHNVIYKHLIPSGLVNTDDGRRWFFSG